MKVFFLLSYTVFMFFLFLTLSNIKNDFKSRISQLALLTCLSIAIWALAYSFIYIAPDAETAYKMHLIGSVGWSLFPALVGHLLLSLSGRNALIESLPRLMLFYALPAVILIKNILGPSSCVAIGFVESITGLGFAYVNSPANIWTYIYFFYVGLYISIPLFFVYQWQSESAYALVKKQGSYVIFVIGFIQISGIISDLFLPFYFSLLPPLSNILIIIFPITYFFVHDRYQIFRFSKIASSEIILNTMIDPVIITDESFAIIDQNEATLKSLGLDEKTISNLPLGDFFKDKDSIIMIASSLKKQPYLKSFETTIVSASRREIEISLSASLIHDTKKGFKGVVFAFHDITQRKKRELTLFNSKEKYRQRTEQLHLAVNYDNLTKLPNRRFFFSKLAEKMQQKVADGIDFSLIFMDLNGFKTINDTFGHDIGDQLLIQAAKRIDDCRQEDDFVSRIGGDEFTIIMSQNHLEASTKLMIEKIKFSFLEPFVIREHCFTISLSAGFSIASRCQDSVDTMIREADQMMYDDKKQIKNSTDINDIFMYE